MPREGTRSATGNSRPRVFQTVDTAPVIKRTTKPKTKKTDAEPTVKPVKPAGVTKKRAPKKDGAVEKVKAAAKKVEVKAKKATAKPKTAAAAK